MFFDVDNDIQAQFLPDFPDGYAIQSNFDPLYLQAAPTHTEDGIPIRKLYVSNLPAKTTRTELFGVFAQFGIIKSCWLRIGEKGATRTPTPTYAFVTFTNPEDAHRALQAPSSEKVLRGRYLRILPADSWHQPDEDADGRVRWKPRGSRPNVAQEERNATPLPESNSGTGDISNEQSTTTAELQDVVEDEEPQYSILNILNSDCLTHILTYVPIRDLIRSERVSKEWRNMVQEHMQGIRTFMTSWWRHETVTLTTAVLRRVLSRVGGALTSLHIDHHWSALNDRTAHTIGKFCPNLEYLKVVGMYTKNWNPLGYGCKKLKNLTYISCNKLQDSSLVNLITNLTELESLTIVDNSHVTGLFLTGKPLRNLKSLSFFNCYSLQATVIGSAIDHLPNLRTLKLDACPVSMWRIMPLILKKLPNLEELSLSQYTSVEISITPQMTDALCESMATLKQLKYLDFSRNICINNAVLKQVGQSCPKLETLDVSICNSRRTFPHTGVGDDGIAAICSGCPDLRSLDVSYLADLNDSGLANVAKCLRLETLLARGNPTITASSIVQCIAACTQLEEVDLCGCDNISEAILEQTVKTLAGCERRLKMLKLQLASTRAAEWLEEEASPQDLPIHKLLWVNTRDDTSNPHLRPDFVDKVFENSSIESIDDDMYVLEHFDDFYESTDEDDLFLEEELDDLEIFGFGMDSPDIIIL